jgi:hypothetical protein
MHHMWNNMKTEINRRSFVKNGLSAAGIATAGIGFLANDSPLLADERPENVFMIFGVGVRGRRDGRTGGWY